MAEAVRLVREATFDPPTMEMMANVFETLWVSLDDTFKDWPLTEINEAKITLAKAIIHFASAGILDPVRLRASALKAMTFAYPELKE
jgi:hypothetical protein